MCVGGPDGAVWACLNRRNAREQEHIAIAAALHVPIIVIVTKIDIAPAEICTKVRSQDVDSVLTLCARGCIVWWCRAVRCCRDQLGVMFGSVSCLVVASARACCHFVPLCVHGVSDCY